MEERTSIGTPKRIKGEAKIPRDADMTLSLSLCVCG
jgi:hypothetical protein